MGGKGHNSDDKLQAFQAFENVRTSGSTHSVPTGIPLGASTGSTTAGTPTSPSSPYKVQGIKKT